MRTFEPNELERRIDEVLYYVWDPIGVSEEPYARAEYTSYVAGVLDLVRSNASAEVISNHLLDIVRRCMGLSPNEKKSLHAAELILEHRQAIDEGCA